MFPAITSPATSDNIVICRKRIKSWGAFVSVFQKINKQKSDIYFYYMTIILIALLCLLAFTAHNTLICISYTFSSSLYVITCEGIPSLSRWKKKNHTAVIF